MKTPAFEFRNKKQGRAQEILRAKTRTKRLLTIWLFHSRMTKLHASNCCSVASLFRMPMYLSPKPVVAVWRYAKVFYAANRQLCETKVKQGSILI